MKRESARTTWTCTTVAIGVVAALALTSADVVAGRVKRNLSPTAHAPGARGQVALVVKHHGKTVPLQFILYVMPQNKPS